jgi:hypothetical protein
MPLAVTRGAVTLTLDSKYARFQSCVNTMESEPARVPGSGANGCAGNAVGFEFSALRSPLMGDETTRWWSPSGKRVGSRGPGIRVLRLPPPVESEPVRWQAPPRKRTGARERAGAQDLHSLLLATTQLVDGACPIHRYCAVRFRGGQPWRDSSVGSERPTHDREVVSSMLTLATAGRWPSRLRQLPYKQKIRRFKPCPPHGGRVLTMRSKRSPSLIFTGR